MGSFDELISQIDAFIRKFYKNQMIKGILLFLIIFLFTFLMVTGLEYIGRFNSFVRAILLFTFLILNGYVLFIYFIQPLLKLFSFGKRISRYQAAKIIGDFFPSVDDKLLNTLQLQENVQLQPSNIAFLQASIQQNSQQLNTFSFTSAIDYSQNKKFLKYFLPILLLVIGVGVLVPEIYRESSNRILNYQQVFEKEPDFSFELQTQELTVEEGASIELEVKLTPNPGKALPDRIYIVNEECRFLMNKESNNKAKYTFQNVVKSSSFHFSALGNNSKQYELEVIKRTSIGHLKVDIEYPAYLERAKESIDNPGDLVVPNGTKLTWNGTTKNAKEIIVIAGDSLLLQQKDPGFRVNYQAFTTTPLAFVLQNKDIQKYDTTLFYIDVIRDEYPSIAVEQRNDSVQKSKLYFAGNVSDDHGLTRVVFTYTIEDSKGNKRTEDSNVPGIDGKRSPFSMTLDIRRLGLALNDKLTYYFTVYDNDGINGPKSTRSSIYQYQTPSLEELHDKRTEEKDKAAEELQELIRESQEFQEEMARLKKDLLNSKNSSWQQKQQVKNLQDQLESLQDRIEKTKQELQDSFDEKSQLSEADERLLEKQQQLEEMLDALMDDELKKLLEELQELLDENRQQDMLEMLENSEMSAEEMERQLDRTMEMLKKMDVEERAKDIQKSMEQLAQDQLDLKEEMKDGLSKEDAKEKQDELNERFEKVKEQFDAMQEKNEELKRPMHFDGIDEAMDQISEEMEKASEDIQDGKSGAAQEKQQNASDKMQEVASQMQAQMQASQEQQNEEDFHALRALLENIIQLSFDQEENLQEFKSTDLFDPHFILLGQEQRSIIDNLLPVKDSLRSLATRIPPISSFIEQELAGLDKQYRYIPGHIGEREKPELMAKQQFAMTHLNNLALFLNESMEAALAGMQGGGEGDDGDDAPGDGGPGDGSPGEGAPGSKGKPGQGMGGDDMQGIKDMIKKQLEQMRGGQPGGNTPSGQPGGFLPMNSQQAAKMAAEQNAMRQKLRELREQLNKDGSGDGNKLNKVLEELDKQQEDLIHKKWDTQLLDRQQEILTRLLESEEALRERGWDEERERNIGKDEDFGNQIEFLEYKNLKEKQIELLRTLDPSFSRYYKDRVNDYFLHIE